MRVLHVSVILGLVCAAMSLRAGESGKVTGKVTWAGDVPKPVMLDITTKPDDIKTCQCRSDETAKASPRLIVDAETKGVKHTVVTLEGVPEDKAKKFPEREALIDQTHCEFAPHIQWVEVDQQLTVKNSDNTLHNVHAKTEDGDVFNFSMPEKDQVIKKKLKDAGLLMLNCDAGHSWMNGFVFVVENPYIAITDDKGNFTIDGVPPGKYKLKFWHEGWQVSPVLDQKTQKPIAYKFSDPVTSEIEVEVKGDTVANVTLSDAGFKK